MRGAEVRGPSASPANPTLTSTEAQASHDVEMKCASDDGMEMDCRSSSSSSSSSPSGEAADGQPMKGEPFFLEVFAGAGILTECMRKSGIHTAKPDEIFFGGTDFMQAEQVEALKEKIDEWAKIASRMVIHLAPPCRTFSRARDRGSATRLRSPQEPGGLDPLEDATAEGNTIALRAFDLALWAHAKHKAIVTIENPEMSYIWDFVGERGFVVENQTDVVFSHCMYGKPYRKHTKVRCFGWSPKEFAKKCSQVNGEFACGRSRDNPHVTLEFGKGNTAEAAEYPKDACVAWANELAKELGVNMLTETAADGVHLAKFGVIHRHASRGTDELGARERKRMEDASSTAGMRNPADLAAYWPKLWQAMKPVRKVLEEAREMNKNLQGLSQACGANPPREPPSEEDVRCVRRLLEEELGVPRGEFERHHPASPLKPGVFAWTQKASKDPDQEVPKWLTEGAPMGLSQPILPGGHFPRTVASGERSLEELEATERWSRNHPSFEVPHGEEVPPGVKKVREMVNAGFGKLYATIAEASQELGSVPHPAPMGNVSKE